MAGNSVAIKVVTTPGTILYRGPEGVASAGSWTAGPISVQTYSKLIVGGQPVIHGASCTFNFIGTTAPPVVTIKGSEDVTLTAGSTVLQKGQSGVLVQGNSSPPGQFGNKLEVQTTNKLTTA